MFEGYNEGYQTEVKTVDKGLQSHAGLDGVKVRSDLGHIKTVVRRFLYMISIYRLYPPEKRTDVLGEPIPISDWINMYDRFVDIPFCTGELGLKEPIGFGEFHPCINDSGFLI